MRPCCPARQEMRGGREIPSLRNDQWNGEREVWRYDLAAHRLCFGIGILIL